MKVHIIQLLCDKRHCLMAAAWEEKFPNEPAEPHIAEFSAVMSGLFALGAVKPECGICQSQDLRYEDGITRFNSLKEAAPHIVELQSANMATRRRFDLEKN